MSTVLSKLKQISVGSINTSVMELCYCSNHLYNPLIVNLLDLFSGIGVLKTVGIERLLFRFQLKLQKMHIHSETVAKKIRQIMVLFTTQGVSLQQHL